MPLTAKGEEIKKAMEEQYGKEKGEQVFYASANKGTITGVHDDDDDDDRAHDAEESIPSSSVPASPTAIPPVETAAHDAGAGTYAPTVRAPSSGTPSPPQEPTSPPAPRDAEFSQVGMSLDQIQKKNQEYWGGEITHGTTTPPPARQEKTSRGAPPVTDRSGSPYHQVGPSIADIKAANEAYWKR
jgi:hypothetical protein